MTDILFPPGVNAARNRIRYLDSTGVSRSPYGGVTRTASLLGDRLGVTVESVPVGGRIADSIQDRAALQAFIAAMQGKQNRAYIWDHGYTRGGSFACPELITNNDFSAGTAGWSVGADATLSVSNGVLRITRSGTVGGSGNAIAYQNPTTTLYAPYCWRAMVGANPFSQNVGPTVGSGAQVLLPGAYDAGIGTALRSTPIVPYASANYYLDNLTISGSKAGDYVDVPWCSLTRCALVDNGPNNLLYSDQIDNAAWSKNSVTVPVTTDVAPDGVADARRLTESAANTFHNILQAGARANAPADLVVYGYFKQSVLARDIRLNIGNDGANYSACTFTLASGTAGAILNVGTATNGRAFISYAGNGWWFCSIVSRAVAAATIYIQYEMVGGGVTSYLGTTGAIDTWRLGGAASSVPTSGAQTVGVALPSGASQAGNMLSLKGLPVSTLGLLLAGDQVEILTSRGSELKIVTAPLNSDAAGLGLLSFSPRLRGVPSDNAAVIISRPMGRFVYSGSAMEWANDPGIISTAAFDFEEGT